MATAVLRQRLAVTAENIGCVKINDTPHAVGKIVSK